MARLSVSTEFWSMKLVIIVPGKGAIKPWAPGNLFAFPASNGCSKWE
jgi:hypothetical protein